jgi:hypothetical protein
MDKWVRDLRYALRSLYKSRGFAFAAVLILASGIGAAVAIFSVADGVLLKPLPYASPDRLVSLSTRFSTDEFGISQGQFVTIEEQSRTIEQIGAFFSFELTFTGRGLPERAGVGRDSLAVLGAGTSVAIGRVGRDLRYRRRPTILRHTENVLVRDYTARSHNAHRRGDRHHRRAGRGKLHPGTTRRSRRSSGGVAI